MLFRKIHVKNPSPPNSTPTTPPAHPPPKYPHPTHTPPPPLHQRPRAHPPTTADAHCSDSSASLPSTPSPPPRRAQPPAWDRARPPHPPTPTNSADIGCCCELQRVRRVRKYDVFGRLLFTGFAENVARQWSMTTIGPSRNARSVYTTNGDPAGKPRRGVAVGDGRSNGVATVRQPAERQRPPC